MSDTYEVSMRIRLPQKEVEYKDPETGETLTREEPQYEDITVQVVGDIGQGADKAATKVAKQWHPRITEVRNIGEQLSLDDEGGE